MMRPVSACGLVLLMACGTTREAPSRGEMGDAAADEAAVRAVDSAWFSAYTAGNADGVVALYADDAVINVPGAPAARGSAAIREAITKDIAGSSGAGVTLTPNANIELGVSGDLAWLSNTFTATDKSGTTVDEGKYVTVLGRRAGEWRIIRDIWNSSRPSAPAAQSAPAK